MDERDESKLQTGKKGPETNGIAVRHHTATHEGLCGQTFGEA